MDLYRSTSRYPFPARQYAILNAVVDYGYLAPRMLALEEAYAQIRQDCALSADPAAVASIATSRPLVDADVVRRRLSETLRRIGARLPGTPPVEPSVPSQVSSTGSRP